MKSTTCINVYTYTTYRFEVLSEKDAGEEVVEISILQVCKHVCPYAHVYSLICVFFLCLLCTYVYVFSFSE